MKRKNEFQSQKQSHLVERVIEQQQQQQNPHQNPMFKRDLNQERQPLKSKGFLNAPKLSEKLRF